MEFPKDIKRYSAMTDTTGNLLETPTGEYIKIVDAVPYVRDAERLKMLFYAVKNIGFQNFAHLLAIVTERVDDLIPIKDFEIYAFPVKDKPFLIGVGQGRYFEDAVVKYWEKLPKEEVLKWHFNGDTGEIKYSGHIVKEME